MKRFALLMAIGLVSCGKRNDITEEPVDLIPRDSMIMLVKRISLIEAYAQNSQLLPNQSQRLVKISCENILKKFHITFDRFDRSMSYYASHQEEMQSIYTEVLDSLTKESSAYGDVTLPSNVPPKPRLPVRSGSESTEAVTSDDDGKVIRKKFKFRKRPFRKNK